MDIRHGDTGAARAPPEHYGEQVSEDSAPADQNLSLPIFPLNDVVFPGSQVPLRVFEERYVAMVDHLLSEPDPAKRIFATTAIREGYEVGTHGAQSLYRTGCILQLLDVDREPDGSYEILTVARQRFLTEGIESGAPFAMARVRLIADVAESVPQITQDLARTAFTAYRGAVAGFSADPFSGSLPRDPVYLSWTLAALAPLPLAQQQRLLMAENAQERLELITALLREELRAINVIPSLPAAHVARNAWSPN